MWEDLEERVLCCAEYIVQTGRTVRACSAHFSISKSTVHKDMTERLPQIDKALYAEVRAILDKNLSERHIRGGNATRKKYELKKRIAAHAAGLHGDTVNLSPQADSFAGSAF